MRRSPAEGRGDADAEVAIANAKRDSVEVNAYGPDGALVHPQLLESYRKRAEGTARYAQDVEAVADDMHAHFDVVLAAIAAGRAELLRLHRAGEIEDEVLHDLERDLDLEEMGVIFQRGT
jgi:CPA1 family monovalent cation:H+ antiporter